MENIEQVPMDYSQSMQPQQQSINDARADIIDKLNPTDVITAISNKWKGYGFVNGVWEQDKELTTMDLTPIAINDITTLMLSVSSQNAVYSDLTNHEINQITLSTIDTLIVMLLKNWKQYGVKSIGQMAMIIQIVKNNTRLTLIQARDNGLKKFISRTTNELITRQNFDNKGIGMWNMLGKVRDMKY